MKLSGAYDEGDRTGIWTQNYSDGQTAFTLNYKKGAADGLQIWYHPNGQKAAEVQYKKGEQKDYSLWDETGQSLNKELLEKPKLKSADELWEWVSQNTEEGFTAVDDYSGYSIHISPQGKVDSVVILDSSDVKTDQAIKNALLETEWEPGFSFGMNAPSVVKVKFYIRSARVVSELQVMYSISHDTYGTFKLYPDLKNGKSQPKLYTIVEEMPYFPGGNQAMFEWLGSNTRYPEKARKNGDQGTVYVTFVVDQDGMVVDARILKGVSKALDKEALRVVNNMPAWTPGRQRGKAVKVQFNLPIRFYLREKN
ncbi:TonB family protein [bacterium SCSIO 12741]|nr:TonB family protein [bacterium SCSIO 12741]